MRLTCALIVIFLSLQAAAFTDTSCRTNRDCALIYDSWCKQPMAVNRAHLNDWRKDDKEHYEQKRQVQQPCEAYDSHAHYRALCRSRQCQAALKPIAVRPVVRKARHPPPTASNIRPRP